MSGLDIESQNAVFETLGEIKYDYSKDPYFFESLTMGYENVISDWIHSMWKTSFLLSIVYVIVIFSIKHYMLSRPRLEIRLPLAAWSGFLAIFSIFGTVRSLPEMVYTLRNHGFHHAACHPAVYYGIPGFWAVAFLFSKPWELGDTIFIVLRKQPLIFLHWYHHITVMVYVFMSFPEHLAPARFYAVMNFVVHAFMYTYYTARALKFQTPKWIAMGITVLQLTQMVIGTIVSIYAYVVIHYWGANHCQARSSTLFWGLAMYMSYFMLFVNFFYQAYIKKRPNDQSKTVVVNGLNGELPHMDSKHNGVFMHKDNITYNGHTKKET